MSDETTAGARPAELHLEVDTHKYEYRDGSSEDSAILAEFDEHDDNGDILFALIKDGHPAIRAWVDGRPTLGSYGSYGVVT